MSGIVDRLLLKNIALYGAHYGFRFIFPLVATPFLAHVLLKEGFAEFAIINSCLWTSTVFMEFGFYIYGVSRVGGAGDDPEKLKQVVSEIASCKLLLAPVAALVYLALTAWTGVLMRDPAATLLGLGGALAYGASFAWYFQGRQKGALAVLSEAAPQLIQLGLLLTLVRSPDQLWLVFALQIIPPLTSLTFALTWLGREKLLALASFATIRSSLKAASPYFVERACYSTYTSVVPSLIALLATRAAVADYSLGDRFATLLIGMSAPLTQAAMPRAVRAAREPDGGWRFSIIVVATIVMFTVVLAAAVSLGAGFVIEHLFSDDYRNAIGVAQILCFSACLSTLGFAVANFILIPRGRANVMFWSSSLALVFGIGAQVALTPRWGATGAALGRLGSETVVSLIMAAAAVQLYRRRDVAVSPQTGP